ncbi:glycosyltransferase [Hoeflea sp.]|uniref:glycosyltransferase n=1 Tax=Hoeflea sp. TaxID=1940281 RepID=UPI0037484663
MTVLSICIAAIKPTAGFEHALKHMLLSSRSDFEIVVGDFRDATDRIREPLAAGIPDQRLRVIDMDVAPASLSAAWNQMFEHAAGEWITIIGENEYADPEICEVIVAVLKRVPDVDALSWGRAEFVPPDARDGREIACVPTGSKMLLPEQTDMMRRLFYWEGASERPDCHFSAWHGAVRRTVLDQIKAAFSNVYFEADRPEIDSLCKVTMLAKRLVFWERPLSVQCRIASGTDADLSSDTQALEGFPFSPAMGVAAATAVSIEAFKRRYGIEVDGWQSGFIAACVKDCETATSGEAFHARKAAYAQAIGDWAGKRGLKDFKPEFKRKPKVQRFQGIIDDTLYFDMAMDDARDAASFYRLINAITFPVHLLDYKLA